MSLEQLQRVEKQVISTSIIVVTIIINIVVVTITVIMTFTIIIINVFRFKAPYPSWALIVQAPISPSP